MARVIRSCWVYNPLHKYRYLPRPNANPPFDYEAAEATPEHFPDKLEEAPKLWVAWLYKRPREQRLWPELKLLFGDPYHDMKLGVVNETWELGKMHVFKNTSAWNAILWKVKHLIEIRPLTFPHGEPTEEDIGHIRIAPDGRCAVDKRVNPSVESLESGPDYVACLESGTFPVRPEDLTHSELLGHNMRKWAQRKEVHEDATHTDPNTGVVN